MSEMSHAQMRESEWVMVAAAHAHVWEREQHQLLHHAGELAAASMTFCSFLLMGTPPLLLWTDDDAKWSWRRGDHERRPGAPGFGRFRGSQLPPSHPRGACRGREVGHWPSGVSLSYQVHRDLAALEKQEVRTHMNYIGYRFLPSIMMCFLGNPKAAAAQVQ